MKTEPNIWVKIEPLPIDKNKTCCACCGFNTRILEMNTNLFFNFGGYSVTKNGKLYYMADPTSDEFDNGKLLSEIEAEILDESENDWRVNLSLPLRGAEWQRHDKNKWVLISVNEGFA